MYGAAKLSHLDQALKNRIFSGAVDLIKHTGALDVENVDEMWNDLMRQAAAREGNHSL